MIADVLADAAWRSLKEPFSDQFVNRECDDETRRVAVERVGARAVVTLCDPATRNALSTTMVQQLKAALGDLVADRAIRAIVITGADPRFSAGGDLRMMERAPEATGRRPGHDLTPRVLTPD